MAYDEIPPLQVFFSYSWDSPERTEYVTELSDRLHSAGIAYNLDWYVEGSLSVVWSHRIDQQIQEANFALMICTNTYYLSLMGEEKINVRLGICWEGNLIFQHINDETQTLNAKCVPHLVKEIDVLNRSDPCCVYFHSNLAAESDYEKFYHLLTNQILKPKPNLGKLSKMPPYERQAEVPFSTQKLYLKYRLKPFSENDEDTFAISKKEETLNGESSTTSF